MQKWSFILQTKQNQTHFPVFIPLATGLATPKNWQFKEVPLHQDYFSHIAHNNLIPTFPPLSGLWVSAEFAMSLQLGVRLAVHPWDKFRRY